MTALNSIEEYIDSIHMSVFGNNTELLGTMATEAFIPKEPTPKQNRPGIINYLFSTPHAVDRKINLVPPPDFNMSDITKQDNHISQLKHSFSEKLDTMGTQMLALIQQTKQETGQKLDEIITHMREMHQALEIQHKEISDLKQENADIKGRSQVIEGRLFRAEKQISDLIEKDVQNTARSMRNNIVLQKVPETPKENMKDVVLNFLEKELSISGTEISRIQIERAHRMGKAGSFPRPIVFEVNSASVDMIMSHAKNLKGKPYSMNIQLPKEMVEKRKQLMPIFKSAKEANKKATWSNDRLFVDNKEYTVKKDQVTDINLDLVAKAVELHVTRAPPKTYSGNTFQGSRVKISSQDDIIAAIHAIYKDARAAQATHNIYAYIVGEGVNQKEHFDDDGEYGAGNRILQEMKTAGMTNTLICVTRWYCGHLGPDRFKYIQEAAKDAIQM